MSSRKRAAAKNEEVVLKLKQAAKLKPTEAVQYISELDDKDFGIFSSVLNSLAKVYYMLVVIIISLLQKRKLSFLLRKTHLNLLKCLRQRFKRV